MRAGCPCSVGVGLPIFRKQIADLIIGKSLCPINGRLGFSKSVLLVIFKILVMHNSNRLIVRNG